MSDVQRYWVQERHLRPGGDEGRRAMLESWQSPQDNAVEVVTMDDYDALARDLQDAVIQLNRASGALIDAGTVSTEDVEAGIRALAREVEELKAKLKIWHDSDDDIMDKHGVDTDGYIKQLERQLNETREAAHEGLGKCLGESDALRRQLAEAQANLEAEEQRGFDRIKERDEAQQRIAELRDERDGCLDDKMNWESECKRAEARLADAEQLLQQKAILEGAVGADAAWTVAKAAQDEADQLKQRLAAITAALEEVRKRCDTNRVGRYEIMQSGTCGYMSPHPSGLFVYFRDLDNLATAITEQAEAALAKET